jgi:hypothetical protein
MEAGPGFILPDFARVIFQCFSVARNFGKRAGLGQALPECCIHIALGRLA